ncbi:acyl-ACP--UDP-N-acetylglucosamine O-acyltransferase [bacterium]|nr:acyl-ACP--UDP-N-acetylglucosamine O-acyltransferase [bacterium]
MIDPRAIVSPHARIAPDVRIGPFAIVEDDVEIGAGSSIGAFTQVCSGTRLGRDNRVHMHVVLGNEPQDLAYRGAPTRLVVGDRNVIREGSHLHRGSKQEATVVGDDCFLMTNSHVGHDCRVGDGAILATGATLGGHATVGPQAFLSGYCLVHQFVRVGRLALIQGGAAASRDVPPFTIAMRPHNLLVGVNVVGLRRAGLDRAAIGAIRRAYRALFLHRRDLRRAREELLADEVARGGPTSEVRELLDFIDSSRRGVSFGRRRASGAPVDDDGD